MFTNLIASTFDAAVATGTVLVIWGAEWHAPSNALANRISKTALKILVYRVDVDQEAELAARFSMRGIPTLIVFVDGQIVARETMFNGAITKFC